MTPEVEQLGDAFDGLRAGFMRQWFEEIVGGGRARGIRSMQVDPAVSLQMLRSAYRTACERSNEIITQADDADSVLAKPPAKARNLRAALLAAA